jgi:hypothetical protein
MVLMKRSQGKDKYLVEAEPMLSEALAIQERVYGPSHLAVGEVPYALGVLALQRKQYAESLDYFVRTAKISLQPCAGRPHERPRDAQCAGRVARGRQPIDEPGFLCEPA